MDLSKLTPAPWVVKEDAESGSIYIPDHSGYPMLLGEDELPMCRNALEFCALARNAFDVMMRSPQWVASLELCWGDPARKDKKAWVVRSRATADIVGPKGNGLIWADDPFTALVEADKWYRENVGGGK